MTTYDLAGFNPAQARGYHGRWSKGGDKGKKKQHQAGKPGADKGNHAKLVAQKARLTSDIRTLHKRIAAVRGNVSQGSVAGAGSDKGPKGTKKSQHTKGGKKSTSKSSTKKDSSTGATKAPPSKSGGLGSTSGKGLPAQIAALQAEKQRLLKVLANALAKRARRRK